MRLSKLFSKSLHQEPAEAETVSHRLLLKAGMIYQVAAGIYSYLPLGWRAYRKIEQIIREEMDAAGGQELMMPVLQPLELWEATGRRQAFGQTLFTLQDRKERELCLGPTHEEIVSIMTRQFVKSYRDLPIMIYQIQTKFRDEPRSRGGLLRVREFDMKDLYSLDADEEGLDISYQKMYQAYKNVYSRCGLSTIVVEADSGAIGGKDSHEFILIAETGENEVIYCGSCDYVANAERAQSVKPPQEAEPLLPIEEVTTPGIKTIEALAQFLDVPKSRTLKAVFYLADEEVVFVTIRGDLEVNEVKLKNALKCVELRLATPEEVEAAGLVAGSASPVGLKGIKSVADDSITVGSNFVGGANKPDTHLKNVNYPRDFQIDLLTDIALAEPGHACSRCGKELQSTRGIEVGHIFKLGTIFSEKLQAFYLDPQGVQRPIVMGCYGIGVGRLLAAAIEQNHDDKGIVWPLPIAPFHVHICALNINQGEVAEAAEALYADLQGAGVEVLFDDRDESAGVKFNDADLFGTPLRLTISPRTLSSQSMEVKKRKDEKDYLVPLKDAVETTKKILSNIATQG